MTIEIKIPDIEADEVETTEILVKVGDKAGAEQSLIIVEGDKASMGVSSPQAGVVKEIKISVGDKTQTGALIMIFGSADGAAGATPVQAGEKKEAAPAAVPAAAVAKDVNIPDIGSNEVEMIETPVKAGDKVEAGRSLIIVEGSKALTKAPAPSADTVEEIKASVGDKVSIGLLIMVFEVAGEADAVAPMAKQEAAPAAAPIPAAGVKEVSVPDIGGDEVEVIEAMARVGGKVAVEQSLITVEGDKALTEAPAPLTGVVKELKVNVDDKMKTDSLTMIFEVEGAAPAAAPTKQEAAAPTPAAKAEAPATTPAVKAEGKSEFTKNDIYVRATPLIRRLACEFDVGLMRVKGTGRGGRILHEDVQAYVKGTVKHAEVALVATGDGAPGTLPWPRVDFSRFGEIEEVKLGRIQKISGANLSRNWVIILYVIHLDKTDITELEAFRKQQNEGAAKRKLGVKTTPVVFIVKATAAVLE